MTRITPLILASLVVGSASFSFAPAHSRAPAAHSRAFVRTVSPATRLASTPPDEEEGGLDLDLGEMFEMFDAADKEEDFEKAAERIKGDKEGK
ncbi:hypothetical protein TeGR_g4656 [Tetraparma gracilis]|uniref:Uncharacterized protein n=1 Tax=Tetraparma gracilis TaxID=2962635 RepID=A0ABQ6ME28_9STRA|nr:hypothetical protein TeGR_g4656 [Tetraparma gracilis]